MIARIPTSATTTISSINVNPACTSLADRLIRACANIETKAFTPYNQDPVELRQVLVRLAS